MAAERSVGFIGLGVMGAPICRNLARKLDGEVVGYDVVPEPLAALAADGVRAAASVAELVEAVEIVFLSLPGDAPATAPATVFQPGEANPEGCIGPWPSLAARLFSNSRNNRRQRAVAGPTAHQAAPRRWRGASPIFSTRLGVWLRRVRKWFLPYRLWTALPPTAATRWPGPCVKRWRDMG